MYVNFNILNQLGSPAINSNTFANRPAAGQTGRLFVSTDTYEIYRDNGTTWDLIGGPGSSTITGTGTATQVAYFTSSQAIGSSANLYWDNANTRLGIGTATPTVGLDLVGGSLFTNTQSYSTGVARANYFDYNLSVAAGGSFTSPNAITALGITLDLTLAGNATIPSGARSGLDAYNTISFTGTGTLTQSQGTYIRAYSNLTAGWAFAGSATGTVTHLAGLRVLFPDNSGSALSVTNNYGLLINDQTANTGTVTYTNRWGIYQEGASDLNYLNANLLLGSTTNTGNKLQVTGSSYLNGNVGISLSSPVGFAIDDIVLQINNPSAVGSSRSMLRLTNGYSGTAWGNGAFLGIDNNLDFYLYNYENNALLFGTNATEKARITAAGNFGIGVSTPSEKLDVGGNIIANSGNNAGYKLNGGLAIYRLIGDDLGFLTASTVRMAITAAGLVGINTTAPATRLHAFGTSGATTILAEGGTNNSAYGRLEMRGRPAGLGQSTGWLVVSSTEGGQAATNVGGIDFTMAGASGNAHNMQFATHNGTSYATRMTLTSGGNLLINTTTNAGERLYLNGSLRIDGQRSATAGGSSGQHLIINLDGTTYKIALLNN